MIAASSPIYSLILGTKTMIVLSSDAVVKELLDRRSGNYSDRPDMYIGQTIASGGLRLVVMVRHSHEVEPCTNLRSSVMANSGD